MRHVRDDRTIDEMISALRERYGSWMRMGRRTGVDPGVLSNAYNDDTEEMKKENRDKVEAAYRRSEIEHFIGLEAVSLGVQVLTGLQELDGDFTDEQEAIIERGLESLKELQTLLLVGNIDELLEEICE